jgi:asparagine synthase (glutamine-hydrolysing)
MCGIAGLWNLDGTTVDEAELDAVTDALAHRGPDGRGTVIDSQAQLGLGHRRLAILDLTQNARLPMSYRNGRYTITYNGEIYNFLELRKELEGLDYTFRTESDTEVILAAYDRWGEAAQLKFNGMWAFAIWDKKERRLFLSRDRYSIKPLYYTKNAGRFAFASEMKALLQQPRFRVMLNEAQVSQLFKHCNEVEGNTSETLLKGVMRLPGGHSLTVDQRGNVSLKKWWDTRRHIPEIPATYEEQVERFKEIFEDAVRIRMRSDVPIATSLSGGLDSSAIASTMAYRQRLRDNKQQRTADDWQRAYIAVFPHKESAEKEYADEVVKAIGARPHYWNYNEEEVIRHIADTVWANEYVYHGIISPAYLTYREARRKGSVVTIDGHGGDELLGGYSWYRQWPKEKFNDNLYQDFHVKILPSILRNFDRVSMAHGVEIRMPFLDWRLVTYTFGLPVETKYHEGVSKRILRDAQVGIMPEKNRLRRSKMGFGFPMNGVFNGALAPMIDRISRHRLWQESPFWDGKKLGKTVRDITRAGQWGKPGHPSVVKIWQYINLVIWQQLFIERNTDELRSR